MKKSVFYVVCIFSLLLSLHTYADECHVFFQGKTNKGEDISVCTLHQEIVLTIGFPHTTPTVTARSTISDVLYVEADTFINDMSASIYSLYIPSHDKWYGIHFARQAQSNYTTSVVIGKNVNPSDFYLLATLASFTPIVRKTVVAHIDFTQFTRMEEPTHEKEYEHFLLSLYHLAGIPVAH